LLLPHDDVTNVWSDSMHAEISKPAQHELLGVLHERYLHASEADKSKILDEFVALTQCHRKHAIRLITKDQSVIPEASPLARRIYSEAVREALVVLWEAADRICGKRLKAVLPDLIAAMERHGHLALDPLIRQHLLTISNR
jgi:hypothetical protein